MSAAHKQALAVGRDQGRIVRAYLEAMERPRRPGRPKTPESMARQIAQLDARLATATPAERVRLIQERFDLKREHDALVEEARVDLKVLAGAFVKVAKEYSDRKGISYAAWREAGVPAELLRRAGVTRSRAEV